jgi:hypothetical protein
VTLGGRTSTASTVTCGVGPGEQLLIFPDRGHTHGPDGGEMLSMRSEATDVDQYLAGVPEDRRGALVMLRALCRGS